MSSAENVYGEFLINVIVMSRKLRRTMRDLISAVSTEHMEQTENRENKNNFSRSLADRENISMYDKSISRAA